MCLGNLGDALKGSADPLKLFHKSKNSVAENLFDPLRIADSMKPAKAEEPAKPMTSTDTEASPDTLSVQLSKKRKQSSGTVLQSGEEKPSDNVLASARHIPHMRVHKLRGT